MNAVLNLAVHAQEMIKIVILMEVKRDAKNMYFYQVSKITNS